MAEWLAERFTDWLASPAALIQGALITLLWLPLVYLGLDRHGFWFLFFATLVSFITQFPIAYASRRSERHMLKLMRLMVALAEDIKKEQEDQEAQLEDIQGRFSGLS